MAVQFLDADAGNLLEPQSDETPEHAFLRQWARDRVTQAQEILRQEYEGHTESWAFEAFNRRVDSIAKGNALSWNELGQEFERAADQVRHTCRNVQRRALQILKDLLAEDGGDSNADLAELLALAGNKTKAPE